MSATVTRRATPQSRGRHLAASVLADSGVEHYRGSFKNKAMFTPLIVSALTLATSVHGTSDMRPTAHRLRDAIYLLAAATGLIGTGFHIYNVGKKVGGFSWQNFSMARRWGRLWPFCFLGLLDFARSECAKASREPDPRSSICRLAGPWRRSLVRDCWARPVKPG